MNTYGSLFAISLPPSLLLLLFGPQLFSFVLGDKWEQAGSFASFMAPLLSVRFAASHVGFVLYVAEKQNLDLYWQAALLIVNCAALLAGATFGDEKLCVILFSLSYSIMYIAYVAISFYCAKSHFSR